MKLFIFLILFLSANAAPRQKLVIRQRIMGGLHATIEEFPSLAALVHIGNKMPICGGSFIAETWILTAAHCYIDINLFFIEYATTHLLMNAFRALTLNPIEFIIHEKFDQLKLNYDIGLVRTLQAPFARMSNMITKLAVPGQHFENGATGFVAGWGTWSETNDTNQHLQKTDLNVYNHKACTKMYEGNNYNLKIYPNQICAGVEDFSKSECSGDSGGPLFIDGIQFGIVSWSIKPCAVAKYPGVYTAVSYFIPWIEQITGIEFEMKRYLIRKPLSRLRRGTFWNQRYNSFGNNII